MAAFREDSGRAGCCAVLSRKEVLALRKDLGSSGFNWLRITSRGELLRTQ